jgi:hypothetical protein
MEIIFFAIRAEPVIPFTMTLVLPEPAFAALLLELHETFIPWTFVGIFTLC